LNFLSFKIKFEPTFLTGSLAICTLQSESKISSFFWRKILNLIIS
jgi:hypothetical protein